MTFVTADLTLYQAKLTSKLQAGELRVRTPEVFNSLRRNTELMIPSHKEIKYAAKRTTGEVNFFTRSSRALGTGGEIHNHTGVVGGSSVIVPAWTPYDDKIKYSVKQANSSVFNLDEMLMNDMLNVNNNFSEGLETVAAAFIHANRSGVNVSTSEGSFSAANDVFEITEDYTNLVSPGYRALQIMLSNMRINKWTGAVIIYADTIGYNKMQALANSGSGNQYNTSFQFNATTMFIHSPELDALAAALSYTAGYFIIEPDGNSAVLDWMPEQNRNGLVVPGISKYGSLIHPTTGLPIATHEYAARADESGGDGEPQDVATQVQFFTYLSLNHGPLSVADETPFYAFALVPAIIS
jgi:hypothetical protein